MTTEMTLTDDLIREMLQRRADRVRPDGVLAEIVRDLEGLPQQPRRRLELPVLRRWQLLPGLAITITVLLLASLALQPQLEPGGTPAPTPSPSPTASVTILRDGGIALGPDRYRTRIFEPTLEFTVSEPRWESIVDLRRLVWLHAQLEGAPADEIDDLSLVEIANVFADSCTVNTARNEAWPPTSGPAELLDG